LIVIMIATEGLLCLRTVALWYNQRIVKPVLVILYLLVCATTTVCLALSLSLDLDSVCSTSSKNAKSQSVAVQEEHILAGSFSAVAFFEFVVVCLTLTHGFASSGFKPSNQLLTSLREGNLLYATILFAMSIANNVFFDLPIIDGWTGLLDVFQAVLHGVMASRIILSLQNADSVTDGERFQESIFSRSFAPMQFSPSTDPENAMPSVQSEHVYSSYTG